MDDVDEEEAFFAWWRLALLGLCCEEREGGCETMLACGMAQRRNGVCLGEGTVVACESSRLVPQRAQCSNPCVLRGLVAVHSGGVSLFVCAASSDSCCSPPSPRCRGRASKGGEQPQEWSKSSVGGLARARSSRSSSLRVLVFWHTPGRCRRQASWSSAVCSCSRTRLACVCVPLRTELSPLSPHSWLRALGGATTPSRDRSKPIHSSLGLNAGC